MKQKRKTATTERPLTASVAKAMMIEVAADMAEHILHGVERLLEAKYVSKGEFNKKFDDLSF